MNQDLAGKFWCGRLLICCVFPGGGGGKRAAGTRTGETEGERGPGSRHPQWDGGQAGAGAQGERGERVSWGWTVDGRD